LNKARLQNLSRALQKNELDAIALNPGSTMTYLTGLQFHLMERPVVLFITADQDPLLVLPHLEMPKAGLFPFPVQTIPYGELPHEWDAAFQQAARALNLNGKRIGIEPRQLRIMEFRHIQAGAPQASYPDAEKALSVLRLRKDKQEIETMRQAVKIAQDALKDTLPLIKIGMTERELAAELTIQLFKHGSDPELPFAPIVSAGMNAANPHASPSDKKLEAGDMLVVDWGATYRGYISDLTRTFAVGQANPEWREIHKIVQDANAAGRAAGKPGAPCADVDIATRNVIEKAGYGKYFNHRTGHGIGMEAHEAPYMRGDNQQLLEAGMAYTVEPGIYLPNQNGVRIEDNVVVTETGVEVLSDMPRELQMVG